MKLEKFQKLKRIQKQKRVSHTRDRLRSLDRFLWIEFGSGMAASPANRFSHKSYESGDRGADEAKLREAMVKWLHVVHVRVFVRP